MMQLKRRTFVGVLAFAVAFGMALGLFATGRAQVRQGGTSSPSALEAPVIPVQMPLTTGTFARVAEAIKPAVINITVNASVSRKSFGRRTPFEEFFGEEFFKRFFGVEPEQIPQRSLGSGVVVDASGIALTNYHVVAPVIEKRDDVEVQIEVITLDGGKHKAKVVGHDKRTDLAVLRLDDGKGSFKAARLGDSDKIQVGDWVLAVGSPFGFQATVTAGIISAKARQIPDGQLSPFTDFLQTDAAINPGNSGGPLVNMQAEIVGINTAIASPTGGSVGIGFAIPSNTARKIYTELLAKGKVSRGWLGVSIQPLTPELAKSFGARDTKGVLVSDVVPDSPAARAGLKAGDIVLEFEGRKVEAPGDLQRAVGLSSPGAEARVKVWRDQSEKTVTVKVGDAPDEREARGPGARARSLLGLEVRPITQDMARQLNLPSTDGVIVARVEDGSGAAEAGIQRGDVIREINRQRVKSLADWERLTKDVKDGDRLTVLLQRGPMSLYVAFTIGRG
jgi:serine protease Do